MIRLAGFQKASKRQCFLTGAAGSSETQASRATFLTHHALRIMRPMSYAQALRGIDGALQRSKKKFMQ
jgi:hypothetical protein